MAHELLLHSAHPCTFVPVLLCRALRLGTGARDMHAHSADRRGAAVVLQADRRVQRLEVLVTVMLARERRVLADAEDVGCSKLAASLAALPSRPLELIAEAVAALGGADV